MMEGAQVDVRENVPIRSFSISVYICRIEHGNARFLLLKRSSPYLHGTWQMVSGKIERGETAWQAALREIREETGLVPDRLYTASELELFYDCHENCIRLVPVFVAFIDSQQSVVLSSEHSEYKWMDSGESGSFFSFPHQVETALRIEAMYVKQTPFEHLRVVTA